MESIQNFKSRQDGWANSWVDDMNQSVGTTQTISRIDTHSKECRFKDVSYGWPLAVLELVNRPVFATTNLSEEGVGEALPAHVRGGAGSVELRKPTAAEMAEYYDIPYVLDLGDVKLPMYKELGKAPWSKTTAPPAPAPAKKPETRVLPSDEAGIEAMVKRMLGQPKSAPPAAPAPQKAPFYKGLLIQASEKYMGLGFNGEK